MHQIMKPIEYICAHEISENSFDAIIDVRSPSEFSADHVPEAINLPALSDSERGDVGSIYKNFSPFEARKLGGALIAENVGQHLRQILVKNKQNWKPLIYCWRGGQRSKAFATILSEVGWKVSVIEGGYKSYRKLVYTSLYDFLYASSS